MFYRQGFTLLELLIVMAIIAGMVAITPSGFFQRGVDTTYKYILKEVNSIATTAQRYSIEDGVPYRLVFEVNKKEGSKIYIQKFTGNNNKGIKQFETLNIPDIKTSYLFPDIVSIKDVLLNGKSIMDKKGIAYCYIVSRGLAQNIIVHLERRVDGEDQEVSFKMNPFYVKFDIYDGFIKS